MHSSRISMQTAPPISPAHSYTIDDGDDSDICPVCDGECTCTKPASIPPSTPGVPLSMAELSLRYATASSSASPVPHSKPKPKSMPQPQPQPPVLVQTKAKPSLKIKLTVPQSMLAKHRASSATSIANTSQTTSDTVVAGYPTRPAPGPSNHPHAYIHQSQSHRPTNPPKKRGRPPKSHASPPSPSSPTTTRPYKPLPPKPSTLPGKLQKRSSAPSISNSNFKKARQNLKARTIGVKKAAAAKRRRVIPSDEDESSSESFDDVDMDRDIFPRRSAYATKSNIVAAHVHDYEGDFPTFVSASAISSMSSDSSDFSSSLSSLDDSDASIEAEEENFIVADVEGHQRAKRGIVAADDALLQQKKRTARNTDWVIRARKKSEGPSDVEMDVDSDATEDDEEDEQDADEADDGDEDVTEEDVTMGAIDPAAATAFGLGLGMGDDDEATTTDDHRYVGHATGWSDDDDESSFDADLFFANLSDTGSSSSLSSSSTTHRHDRLNTPFSVNSTPMSLSLGEEGDQSDISGALSDGTECPSRWSSRSRRAATELESLPFEVTEGWDGEVIFTNGKYDGQNMVDIEFENDAERFGYVVDERGARHAYPYQNLTLGMEGYDWTAGLGGAFQGLGGVQSALGGSDDDDDGVMSDGGYEEEDGGEGEGDTTDEELVGEDDLPNERAMRLFSLPQSVSAINPLSTVSSPIASPGGAGLGFGRVRRRLSRLNGGSVGPGGLVRPADILEGRVTFWDSDEMEHDRDDLGMLSARQERVWGKKETARSSRKKDKKARRKESRMMYEGIKEEMEMEEEMICQEDEEEMRECSGEMNDESAHGRRGGARSRRRRSGAARAKLNGNSSDARDVQDSRESSPSSSPNEYAFRGPRKGVFVTNSAEMKLAVIAEDRKGTAVPSPHPRFNRRGRGRGSAVEHLLRRHLLQSLTAANISTASGLALNNSISIPAPAMLPSSASTPSSSSMNTPMSATNSERSPFEQLLLASAARQSVPTSPGASADAGNNATTPMMMMMMCDPPHREAEPIELDDVLEASFLDELSSSSTPSNANTESSTPAASGSNDSLAPGSSTTASTSTCSSNIASTSSSTSSLTTSAETDDAKDLSRWDLISVGAFRQTRERGWDATVAGNAIRSAPLAAMMWQQNNASSVAAGAAGMGGMGMGIRTASSSMIKGSKLAKRRKLMMSASTMSSPLILPSASAAMFNGSASASSSSPFLTASKSHTGSPVHHAQDDASKTHNHQQHQQKSRKELRRERKVLKRSTSGSGLQAHHHTHHQFHAHHHHPNTKTRSACGAQRSGGFLAGVPPLNL